ncbi:uncharacterized protein K460DRAFT_325687 [Cucurbitaria berberidis CBS 394.84]|uniref:Copper acquisition factor BIM1-like domain-containing protein n=1 Tax=Cucurbitaria berberidis CBS 394.84 TaxID=1168544 RepID=A0A9P4LF67_9PLEO|nr:uncharacterized protein K460DRAFT_325687 [Cucurbitaria berberidis CBS 394.84]KAF1852097.1 hypothetical protein K460DRAFT_325687 [Cucurbitaria berberidis CBS 394.84]
MLSNTFVALSLLPLTLAHFQLTFPKARGFSDDVESNFPCGGFNDVQKQRTDFPISGGPIQLNMGHPQTNIAVYVAIGDNPGSGFSVVARQQLTVDGLGNFCIGSISLPTSLNVSDGTLASIQVVSNNHESGGLYQCADVKLVNTQLSQTDYNNNCKNNTNVRVSQENISGNPNGSSTNASPSTSATGATPSSSKGAAAQAKAVSWVLGAVGLAGMAML